MRADAFYPVKSKDTLSNIAAEFDTARDGLADVNELADINLIVRGQRLHLPSGWPALERPLRLDLWGRFVRAQIDWHLLSEMH
ncbi:MAG TPA: LysM peptidoglycan-binding domain-containing protein [Dehalococcoidia bacterium]|nr:LysM peptidoglycan-binding domain-containing protein [Dehalococcoidia bacterium]